MTWQTKTDALTPQRAASACHGSPACPNGSARTCSCRRTGAPTWRRVLAGVLFVVAGAAVSLTRTSGPGALNSTWIEDAGNFLQDGLNHSVLTTLTTQMNGYYNVVPRMITAVAVAFPVAWAPGIMSAAAAAEYALFGLIVYIASGPFLRSPWLRLLIAVPACVVPLGYTQVNNDLATVQFVALYGLFWLLLWQAGDTGGPGMRATHHARRHADQHPACLLGAPGGGAADSRPVEERDRRRRVLGGGPLAQWSVQLRGYEQPDKRLVHQPAVDPRQLRDQGGAAGDLRRAGPRRPRHQLPGLSGPAEHPQYGRT